MKQKRTSNSTFLKMFIFMMVFGLGMGLLFPLYASFFVIWIDESKIWFVVGCIFAGVFVGVANYFIARTILARPFIRLSDALEHCDRSGDFSRRLPSGGRDLVSMTFHSFNRLLDSIQTVNASIAESMDAVKTGDFTRTMEGDLSGELKALKSKVNYSIHMFNDTLRDLVEIGARLNSNASDSNHAASSISAINAEQASDIEQITSSMNTIAGLSAVSSGNARNARRLAEECDDILGMGNAQMQEMFASIV